MLKMGFKACIYILITIFLTSCTSTKQEVVQEFIIPDPPELPRFKHLKTYRGEVDFKDNKDESFLGVLEEAASKNFGKPFGIAASKGKIYVADTAFGVVFVLDTVLKKVTFIGDQSKGKLTLPVAVALDENDNIYVSDSKSQRVYGYNQQGEAFFVLGENDDFIRPTGIAINRELGIIYVVDTKAHIIRAYSLTGDHMFDIGERGDAEGMFNFPTNVVVDQNSGNVIVADTQNFRVQIFDQDGNFIHTFGNLGDKPGTFSRAKGIAVDSDGNIYVSDVAFDNIQIFDKTGTKLLLYFGGAGVGPGQFQIPTGLAFDENDRLHTVENFAGRVQVFQYYSDKWKQNNKVEFNKLLEEREDMLDE